MENTARVTMKRSLSSIIHSVFRTEADCAKKLNWDRQRLNRITNGTKQPTISEVAAITAATGRNQTEIADIFLAYWSPNG